MNTDELLKKLLNKVESLERKVDVLTKTGNMRQSWTTQHVIEFLGVHRNTVYKYKIELGAHYVGRQLRFKPELVENFRTNN